MENLSCNSNQTKEPIFIKTKHELSISKSKDAIDEIWALMAQWIQRRCHLKMLTDYDDDDGPLPILYAAPEPSALVS